MTTLAITRPIAARAVHLRIHPRPTTIQQSSAIYRLIKRRFGELDHFKNLRYDLREPFRPSTCLAIFRDGSAAAEIIQASPLTCRMEIGGGVHGEGVVTCDFLDAAGLAQDPEADRPGQTVWESPESVKTDHVVEETSPSHTDRDGQDLPKQYHSDWQSYRSAYANEAPVPTKAEEKSDHDSVFQDAAATPDQSLETSTLSENSGEMDDVQHSQGRKQLPDDSSMPSQDGRMEFGSDGNAIASGEVTAAPTQQLRDDVSLLESAERSKALQLPSEREYMSADVPASSPYGLADLVSHQNDITAHTAPTDTDQQSRDDSAFPKDTEISDGFQHPNIISQNQDDSMDGVPDMPENFASNDKYFTASQPAATQEVSPEQRRQPRRIRDLDEISGPKKDAFTSMLEDFYGPPDEPPRYSRPPTKPSGPSIPSANASSTGQPQDALTAFVKTLPQEPPRPKRKRSKRRFSTLAAPSPPPSSAHPDPAATHPFSTTTTQQQQQPPQPRKSNWPPRSPHQPQPGTILTFTIHAQASTHNHRETILTNPYNAFFRTDRKSVAGRDLAKRVPLRGLAEWNFRKEGKPWRIVMKHMEESRAAGGLREIWERAQGRKQGGGDDGKR